MAGEDIFVIYTIPRMKLILLLIIASDLAVAMVIFAVYIQELLLVVLLCILISAIIDISIWLYFRMRIGKAKRLITKAQAIANSIGISGNNILLRRGMPVSKGKFIMYFSLSYSPMLRRGTSRSSVRFEPIERQEFATKLSFFKLEDFVFSDRGELMWLELPAWRIEDPEFGDGKDYILIIPLEPTLLEDIENSITLSHKDDAATFSYRIHDRSIECKIYYSPSGPSRTTRKAKVRVILPSPVPVPKTLGEVSEPYTSKSFAMELIPRIDSPKVLVVYPGALRLGLRLGDWRGFMRQIRRALNIPDNTRDMTSKQIILEFILERKFAIDVKHREEVKLKVR